MSVFKWGLWGVTALAVAFAAAILLIPADQFQMVLNLRNGHVGNPGKWLVILPLIFVFLNLGALRERQQDPTVRDDWKLPLLEVVMMGFFVVEQVIG
ncbi:hypothetical protein [Lacticaseibacillus jixiensis]|uniref:hypothetical protein n=1 Tax=Lacticaseibacillus jixiensis TaxID=3231926 RepID=UPI0036F39E54